MRWIRDALERDCGKRLLGTWIRQWDAVGRGGWRRQVRND